MKPFRLISSVLLGACVGACGGDEGGSGSEDSGPIVVQECEGEAIVPFQGKHRMVFSSLEIGGMNDGFDLNGDGNIDNKFAGLASLAKPAIEDAFKEFSLVLPLEFFDVADTLGEDECVKFAVYQSNYTLDIDTDDKKTAEEGGDCNDHLATAAPGLPELPDNGIDDDCDGLADEAMDGTPSTNADDTDGDGMSIADGDCDDTNGMIKPGLDEICGDGLDNDCDGVADWTVAATVPVCSPYDEDLDPLVVGDESFTASGEPQIAFKAATITAQGDIFKLKTSPSFFNLTLPVSSGIDLTLKISQTVVEGDLVMTPGGWALQNATLGGVLDTQNLDTIRGLELDQIGLRPEDSLADAMYTNVLGTLLGLRLAEIGSPGDGCLTPDIDIDGDGLEAFCDTTSADPEPKQVVDKCVDGDGTVVMDTAGMECSAATDDKGNARFVDGISIALIFDTVPAALAGQ